MISRKLSVVALSGLTAVLSLSAMAQDASSTTSSSTTSSTTTSGAMGGSMSGDSMSGGMSGGASAGMSMQPMMVSGTVLRYYTDRSGYVTAADVQTAEGTRMVRFAPGMAQRLYSTYPVGGMMSGYVQPSMSMGMTRYDLVSMGDQMPAAGMMQPSMTSDTESLKAEPFITVGSKMIQFTGSFKSAVTDENGEILGLVLNNVKGKDMMGMMGGGMMNASMSGGSMADGSMAGGSMAGGSMAGGSMAGGMSSDTSSSAMSSTGGSMSSDSSMGGGMTSGGMMGGMMENTVLVRVPRELRHPSGEQFAGSERVAPLFKGALIEVVGYAEAPRYGVVSAFNSRVAASALVVNGRAVGAVGLPMMAKGHKGMMMGMGGMKGTPSKEEMGAMNMGYSTYGMSSSSGSMDSSMGGGNGMGGNDPSSTTGTTGATGGTMGGPGS